MQMFLRKRNRKQIAWWLVSRHDLEILQKVKFFETCTHSRGRSLRNFRYTDNDLHIDCYDWNHDFYTPQDPSSPKIAVKIYGFGRFLLKDLQKYPVVAKKSFYIARYGQLGTPIIEVSHPSYTPNENKSKWAPITRIFAVLSVDYRCNRRHFCHRWRGRRNFNGRHCSRRQFIHMHWRRFDHRHCIWKKQVIRTLLINECHENNEVLPDKDSTSRILFPKIKYCVSFTHKVLSC